MGSEASQFNGQSIPPFSLRSSWDRLLFVFVRQIIALMKYSKNDSWIIDTGDLVIEKMSQAGMRSLNDWERVVYCVWCIDYSIRNAGDLHSASDLYRNYKSTGLRSAKTLGLPRTSAAFALPNQTLIEQYYRLFDELVKEIRAAKNI
jgi:hypothetical protein